MLRIAYKLNSVTLARKGKGYKGKEYMENGMILRNDADVNS